MGTVSEAFRLVETGGDPRQHPTLTGNTLRYLDLDYRLLQRQVKEELQLEKSNVASSDTASRTRGFESASIEERARTVLIELEMLMRDHGSDVSIPSGKVRARNRSVLSNPLYRQEILTILATSILRCRRPLLNTQAIIRSLRALQDPATLITFIIANQPAEFTPTIEALLDTDDPYNNSKAILLRLCKLGEHKIWSIRQRLIDRAVFPNLAIELTIEHCHDEICFMNRILRGQPEWLTNGMDPMTKSSLTSIIEFVFSSLNDELTSERPDHVAVNRLLRILAGMIGLMGLSLSAEQLEISLGVLEMAPVEPSTVDVKICLLLMSASQLLKYSQHRVERVLHNLIKSRESARVLYLLVWFQQQQLLKIDDFASKSLSMTIVVPRAGLMELSTLFSALFSNEELATCALQIGRPNPISSSTTDSLAGSISAGSTPATPILFPPPQLTTNVDDPELRSTANFLVGYLLQQDVFHKSGIDVRSWVMEQIQASTSPLDANMIHLLRAYTSAIARSKHVTRIPEHEVRTVFSDPCEDLTPPKVLLVLYMLMNNDASTANLGSKYDAGLLEHIQIRKVILYVQNHDGGTAFQAVQPMFLKLVNSQFPELFDVTTLLLEEGLITSSRTATMAQGDSSNSNTDRDPQLHVDSKGVRALVEPHIKAIVNHISNPDAAIKGYHVFQRLPQRELEIMAREIVQASLPSLLDPRSDPAVMEAFKNTWDRLNSVMPHELWAMTIHALLPQSQESLGSMMHRRQASSTPSTPQQQQEQQQEQRLLRQDIQQRVPSQLQIQRMYHTFEWFVQDPLLLFKVDFRVFRTPIVFRLFVQILGAVMVGSRHWFRKQFHASQAIGQGPPARGPGPAQRRQFKEANLSAMLYIQDSTLIQLMLEACQAGPEDVRMITSEHAVGLETRVNNSGRARREGNGAKAALMAGMTKDGGTAIPDATAGVSDVLKEIRVVTFNFLHQLFIDHKIFPKLVHFQGYALDLVPITVAGIDSIHVCLDFLQEILFASPPVSTLSSSVSGSSSDGVGAGARAVGADGVSPQVFALRLAAQLCERFPLQNTMQMAVDLILPRMQSLLVSTGFAREVLESAVVLAKAFPSLAGDIVDMVRGKTVIY
ncbi:Integrator complex subunit 2 [Dissophora globulifera]|uniref:Integrator complex subunit 2 n=1 Tax=Dissophora globulifera TaxID=979702 RepID=A0A9P6UZP2_9FUNG|nr:Integrator complex subunit 2 [Dissophora globulifera]